MIPAHPQTGVVENFAAQNYWERLHPWCVIRLLPKMQRIVVQRFRTRSQAEEYLKILKRLTCSATHHIVFDPTPSIEG